MSDLIEKTIEPNFTLKEVSVKVKVPYRTVARWVHHWFEVVTGITRISSRGRSGYAYRVTQSVIDQINNGTLVFHKPKRK